MLCDVSIMTSYQLHASSCFHSSLGNNLPNNDLQLTLLLATPLLFFSFILFARDICRVGSLWVLQSMQIISSDAASSPMTDLGFVFLYCASFVSTLPYTFPSPIEKWWTLLSANWWHTPLSPWCFVIVFIFLF